MWIVLLQDAPVCIVFSACKFNFCPQTCKRKAHEKITKSGAGREKSTAKEEGKQPSKEDTKSKKIAGV